MLPAITAIENILVGHHPRVKRSWIGPALRTRATVEGVRASTQRAMELLNFVGLKGKGDVVARNQPYGDQRRLKIARALANKPRFLLLDEPAVGMNPNETATLTTLICRLRDELALTILLIEHEMKVVMTISDQVTVLDCGVKIAEGSSLDVQHIPAVIEACLDKPIEEGIR